MNVSRLFLVAGLLAFSANTLRAADTNLVLRMFPIPLEFFIVEPWAEENGTRHSTLGGTDAKEFFRKCGVTFPEGAYMAYNASSGLLHHYNTEENQRLMGRLISHTRSTPNQIRFDVLFVDFPSGDIEKLARANTSPFPRSEDILQLWQDGQGRLLHALKLITRSGVNAQVQAVSEHIYATDFRTPSTSDAAENAGTSLPVPNLFDTREAGAIFNATPTVRADSRTIEVVLAPELASKPDWQPLAVTGSDADGNDIHLAVPLPVFHSRNITTSIVVQDGETAVLGGMDNPKGDGITYLFLTVTLIDSAGQPVADYAGDPPTQ